MVTCEEIPVKVTVSIAADGDACECKEYVLPRTSAALAAACMRACPAATDDLGRRRCAETAMIIYKPWLGDGDAIALLTLDWCPERLPVQTLIEEQECAPLPLILRVLSDAFDIIASDDSEHAIAAAARVAALVFTAAVVRTGAADAFDVSSSRALLRSMLAAPPRLVREVISGAPGPCSSEYAVAAAEAVTLARLAAEAIGGGEELLGLLGRLHLASSCPPPTACG